MALNVLLGLASALMPGATGTAQRTDCFAKPSACGYPDPTNTGVPDGTRLTPSGSITIVEDDTTIDALDITGTVAVAADRVTIQRSRITRTTGGEGSYAVVLEKGADDFTIRESEIAGPRSNSAGLQSAVWNHHNNPGARAVRSHFHRCADCWEGSGTFRDDYLLVDAAYSGSHDEGIYVCGGKVSVIHSTIVNRHEQTAAVFGDTSGCGGNHIGISHSLLAGGGFVLYPQANSTSRTGSMRILGNRFARCRSTPVFEHDSGGTVCRRGHDRNGVFPKGGYYGLAAHYYLGGGHRWNGNVWDDNLKLACLTSSC